MTPYRRAPCDALVKPEDYEAYVEECEFCNAGGSVFDRSESEERRADDPRHGQARYINRERYEP